MIQIRNAEDRGPSKLAWLDSKHTFSFAGYYDPNHMGFETLRVINDDRVVPGAGFGSHPHNNMEILTYVLAGALEHKDSMGNGSIIKAGDVQLMSAGTGVLHSEFNHSKKEAVHFLQIWVLPERNGLTPGYQQKFFGEAEKRGRLQCVAAGSPGDGALKINQDVAIYAGLLDGDEQIHHEITPDRAVWLHVARGSVRLNGEHNLKAGDGVAIRAEKALELDAGVDAEVLVFDFGQTSPVKLH